VVGPNLKLHGGVAYKIMAADLFRLSSIKMMIEAGGVVKTVKSLEISLTVKTIWFGTSPGKRVEKGHPVLTMRLHLHRLVSRQTGLVER